MKKTLFLALLSLPLILTACAKNKATATTSTVPQITAEAPTNVKGKTFVFKFANGSVRDWDYFAEPLNMVHIDKMGRTAVRGCEGYDYVWYTKTSHSTAKIELKGSDDSVESYKLIFSTPTSGTAVNEFIDWDGKGTVEASNITFSIK